MQLTTHYLRPVGLKSGTLACTAEVLHAGRRLVTAEARLFDASGQLCGHATSTCMILPQPP